ncbi:hypothetical protein DEJ48_37505 [Streptomyces venezuelae]|uniref:Secreted protein n=1 Tax=Streptomyces venezuelae TaxID=54571 RepID=A0A5P2C713_STRVZ|nr:hypothetical protein [Streptomyces venezuelae]QES38363.1 hypothetical protein DEJ48_37505 [Streptomyces venezuelae]
MSTRVRLRALMIVIAALAAVAMPTAAAFADTPRTHHATTGPPPHLSPREEIQPAAHIVGDLARKSAERSTGRPIGMLPEQSRDTACDPVTAARAAKSAAGQRQSAP